MLLALAPAGLVGVLALGSLHERWDPVRLTMAGVGVAGAVLVVLSDRARAGSSQDARPDGQRGRRRTR